MMVCVEEEFQVHRVTVARKKAEKVGQGRHEGGKCSFSACTSPSHGEVEHGLLVPDTSPGPKPGVVPAREASMAPVEIMLAVPGPISKYPQMARLPALSRRCRSLLQC